MTFLVCVDGWRQPQPQITSEVEEISMIENFVKFLVLSSIGVKFTKAEIKIEGGKNIRIYKVLQYIFC